MTDQALRDLAMNARAWPFEEARKLIDRLDGKAPAKGYVLFETGYGPSGLPHIGTFGEVARTTWVRRAFEMMSDIPTKLIAFSDDMDGFRKVPDNLPEQEMLRVNLGKPLTSVPDPFGTHDSLGAHNNGRLNAFLDRFGFDYEFYSSTECYKSGRFDEALMAVLRNYDAVTNVILPTLGPDRRATYSPFLPLCPRTGQVLQVPIVEKDVEAGTVSYDDPETGERITVPVTGGHCKLQWKCDWAMRWHALEVDYEMAGKDLIDSVKLSSKIQKILGTRPPEGFNYELFLDDQGQKISKSKGNGLSIEEWLSYGTEESISLFMFQQPRRAKRLFFDVIPKNVDEYQTFLSKLSEEEDPAKQLENPAWHIHHGTPPAPEGSGLSFGLLLNLASVCHAEEKSVVWGYVERYAPGASPEANPGLDALVGYAVRYYQDFVRPTKVYRAPSDQERAALEELKTALGKLAADTSAEDLQTEIYEIGKRHEFENLRDWFKALYEILLGQSQGPRMGSFIALYGVNETIELIGKALNGDDLAA